MKTKNKIIFTVILLISFMFLLITVDMIYNFRKYGVKSIDDKAHAVAKTIEHTLTSQMVNGTIEHRELFLSQLKNIPNIDKIWLNRGQKVIDLYGEGIEEEKYQDAIDKHVLATGEVQRVINDNLFTQSSYRISIPYKATANGKINCISCHTNAKEGDTLGSISLKMSIDDTKEMGIATVSNTILIALVLMITITILLNFIISPFLSLFDSIKKVMHKAQEGDYSYRVEKAKGKEAKDVSLWINGLLEKLETTLENIDSKISIFLSDNQKVTSKDHLINVKNTVDRLSDVYKFRKTIEFDETNDVIYERLAQILETQMGVDEFNFFEINTATSETVVVYSKKEILCDIFNLGCRSDRTNIIVDSTQFKNICPACTNCDGFNYFCIPYSISNEIDLIISIYARTKKESLKIKEMIPYIQDYVDAAKTVIISKKLMHTLEMNAQTDSLTNLKNRKYLEDTIPKITSQTSRSNIQYGVLLLDIDFFKVVNDTYGHDIGDKALKLVARILNESIREADIAIRFGGEEFLILLYNCDEESIFTVAEKIRTKIEQTEIPIGTISIKKTVSIGTSIFPKDSENINDCIKFSDLALYKAKNSGRNQVVKFDESML